MYEFSSAINPTSEINEVTFADNFEEFALIIYPAASIYVTTSRMYLDTSTRVFYFLVINGALQDSAYDYAGAFSARVNFVSPSGTLAGQTIALPHIKAGENHMFNFTLPTATEFVTALNTSDLAAIKVTVSITYPTSFSASATTLRVLNLPGPNGQALSSASVLLSAASTASYYATLYAPTEIIAPHLHAPTAEQMGTAVMNFSYTGQVFLDSWNGEYDASLYLTVTATFADESTQNAVVTMVYGGASTLANPDTKQIATSPTSGNYIVLFSITPPHRVSAPTQENIAVKVVLLNGPHYNTSSVVNYKYNFVAMLNTILTAF